MGKKPGKFLNPMSEDVEKESYLRNVVLFGDFGKILSLSLSLSLSHLIIVPHTQILQ